MLSLTLKRQYFDLQVYHAHIPPCWLDPLPVEHACSNDRVCPSRARNGHDRVPHPVLRCRNIRVWLVAFPLCICHSQGNSNVLGGNFALVGSPSVGASGAIFGTVAVSVCIMDALGHLELIDVF